jgi:hypothetical protein
LQVLVDLHGGDPNDITANAEFAEIKDFVTEIVEFSRVFIDVFMLTFAFVARVR